MDRLVLGPAPVGLLGLGLVGDHHELVRGDPRHALGRAVDDLAVGVPRQCVRRARARDLPARRGQPADPQRRGDLRYDRNPITADRDAAVVLERDGLRQLDGAEPFPLVRSPPEDVHPPAAGNAAFRSSPAPVALTQPEQVGLPLAADAGQSLDALVRPVEREVQPGLAGVAEPGVVLLHLGHVPRPAPRQRFDQDVVAAVPRVVGDVLEAGTMALVLPDDVVGLGRGRYLGADPRDMRQVVEDDVEHPVLGQHAAGFKPGIEHPVEDVEDLRLPDQLKLLHRGVRGHHRRPPGVVPSAFRPRGRQGVRGRGSMMAGNPAAFPRGVAALSRSSCWRALSYRIRT